MTIPGQRTLLESLRETAARNPEAVAIHQIALNGEKETNYLLTYVDLVKRIDELSWWLSKQIAKKVDQKSRPKTIAYLAPNDLRTLLIPLAAAECNLVVLLLSPRNSFGAQAHLIATNQCSTLIVDKVFNHVASNVHITHRIEAPDLWHILAEREVHVRPYSTLNTWTNCQAEGIVKMHTSGSTGLPKSVHLTHAVLSTVDIQRTITDFNGEQCQLAIFAQAKNPYTAFPFFHVAGFEIACFMLFSGNRIVLGPPHLPTSLEVVRTVLRIARPDAVLLPPSVLDDIVLNTVLLEEICQVDLIFYGGGQVSNHTGDVLARSTRLFNGIGSTEIGSICLMPLKAQDWRYFSFSPENGITWQPIGTKSGEYELIITKDPQYRPYQAVFHSFPELSEWRTKDIFAKHPSIEDLWEYRGRLDDLIVLSTGEKLNPSVIEAVILSNSSHIKSALVIGSRRPRPALLVELNDNLQGSMVNDLGIKNVLVQNLALDPTQAISRDAQIAPEDIIISSVDKPFYRTGKGTVHRQLTQDLYQLEIDAIYSQLQTNDSSKEWNLDNSSIEGLRSSLLKQFRDLLHSKTLEVSDNLFYFGLDSRQAQIAALSIRNALSACQKDRIESDDFKVDAIYSNPTIMSLSQRLLRNTLTKFVKEAAEYQQIRRVNLEDYHKSLAAVRNSAPNVDLQRSPSDQHVLLTGSTGFVGSYILEALIARPGITRITCLDRANPGRTHHYDDRTFHVSVKDTPYIRKITACLSEMELGILSKDYQDLLTTVTCVVHCQWPVDFNQPLSYFSPNIKGVSNLVQFCLQTSVKNCPLIFISSIATVQRYPVQPVPEIHLSAPEHCQTGYGESKLLASEILDLATIKSNLSAVVCRLGQVCGPLAVTNQDDSLPTWPSRDWFPTLLRCSKFMGYLPDTLAKASRIDWIPVDILAEIIVDEVVYQSQPRPATSDPKLMDNNIIYRHLVNPKSCHYTDLLPVLQRRVIRADNRPCKTISLDQWTKELEGYCLQTIQLPNGQGPPGMELLQFFQDLSKTSEHDSIILETKKTVEALPRLGSLSVVCDGSLDSWLDAWKI